jgi:uncharacterized protein (DUF1778 family)
MALSEARMRANRKYNEKAYDRIALNVKKGKREEIKAFADSKGETVNGFINRAINEAMGKEGQNDE